jgi:hypothetical protein
MLRPTRDQPQHALNGRRGFSGIHPIGGGGGGFAQKRVELVLQAKDILVSRARTGRPSGQAGPEPLQKWPNVTRRQGEKIGVSTIHSAPPLGAGWCFLSMD